MGSRRQIDYGAETLICCLSSISLLQTEHPHRTTILHPHASFLDFLINMIPRLSPSLLTQVLHACQDFSSSEYKSCFTPLSPIFSRASHVIQILLAFLQLTPPSTKLRAPVLHDLRLLICVCACVCLVCICLCVFESMNHNIYHLNLIQLLQSPVNHVCVRLHGCNNVLRGMNMQGKLVAYSVIMTFSVSVM